MKNLTGTLLDADGPLAKNIEGFQLRPQQQSMYIAVEEAIHKTAVHLHFTVTQTMKLVAARPGTSSGRKNTPA